MDYFYFLSNGGSVCVRTAGYDVTDDGYDQDYGENDPES